MPSDVAVPRSKLFDAAASYTKLLLSVIPDAVASRTNARPVGQGELAFNVDDYGAVPSGSEAQRVTNTNAFVAAEAAAYAARGYVTMGGHTKQPETSPTAGYCLNAEFKHRVPVRFFGNRFCNRVYLASNVNKTANVFTNWQNSRSKYANGVSGALRTYDTDVTVEGVWADGNQQARADAGGGSGDSINDQSTSGCGFGYAGVRNWRILNCHASNNWLHNYDVSASYYVPETSGNNEVYPELPSQNVTVENCSGGNVRVDDCFTTHGSVRVRFINCVAIWTGNGAVEATSPGYTQNAFEADETSRETKIIDCYANGWIKGYQIKGHRYTAPSQRTTVSGCKAENCGYSVSLEYSNAGGITQDLASRLAYGVVIRDFISETPATKYTMLHPPSGFSVLDEQRGLSVYGYNGVQVDGWLSQGGTQNHIYCYGTAKNLDFRHIIARDCFTEQYGGHTQDAFILFTTTTGNATLRDSWSETPMYGPFFEYQNADPETANFKADNIQASKASGASSNWVGRVRLNDGSCKADRIVDLGGYGHGLRVDIPDSDPAAWEYWDGIEQPYNSGRKYVQDADWQEFTMAAGTPGGGQASGTTVDSLTSDNKLRILIRGRRVEWDGSFLTKTGAQLTGIQTYAKAPGGMWPANEHTVVLITDSGTTYRGWINSAGELRSGTSITNPLPPNTKVSIVSSTYAAGQGS